MRNVLLYSAAACIALTVALCQETAPSRGLLKRGLLAKKGQTTTTTTQAPQVDAQYAEEEYVDESEEGTVSEATSETPPSTEGKKILGTGARPLRNDNKLLEALKRKRAQAAEAKSHGHTSSTTPAPQETSSEAAAKPSGYNGKKRFSTGSKYEHKEEEAAAPSKNTRNRFSRPKSYQVEEAEESEPQPQPIRTGRTFNRRGSN